MGKDSRVKDSEVYEDLMRNNDEGRFLYSPQPFSDMSPGSVGFFDYTGDWNEITNILDEARLQKDGYTPFRHTLEMRPAEPITWKLKCSESMRDQHARITGGLSGAMASVPGDVSVQAKNSSSSTGKAALITPSEVVRERFKAPFKPQIKAWILENAKKFLAGPFGPQIKDHGMWSVQATWATEECAIKMTSGESQEIDMGLDLAATGIGKVGLGGGWSEKLQSENWKVRTASEDTKGWVVSFAGAKYDVRSFSRWKDTPLKEVHATISLPVPGEKQTAEGEGEGDEDGEGDLEVQSDTVGMSESDIEAEREYERQEEERKAWMRAKWMEISAIEDPKEKAAELKKLLQEIR